MKEGVNEKRVICRFRGSVQVALGQGGDVATRVHKVVFGVRCFPARVQSLAVSQGLHSAPLLAQQIMFQ